MKSRSSVGRQVKTIGEDPQKAINAIAKDMDVSKRRAGTLVMTESAAIATAAQRDCYNDPGVEEFEYVCIFDEVTCPVCGAMNGENVPEEHLAVQTIRSVDNHEANAIIRKSKTSNLQYLILKMRK